MAIILGSIWVPKWWLAFLLVSLQNDQHRGTNPKQDTPIWRDMKEANLQASLFFHLLDLCLLKISLCFPGAACSPMFKKKIRTWRDTKRKPTFWFIPIFRRKNDAGQLAGDAAAHGPSTPQVSAHRRDYLHRHGHGLREGGEVAAASDDLLTDVLFSGSPPKQTVHGFDNAWYRPETLTTYLSRFGPSLTQLPPVGFPALRF